MAKQNRAHDNATKAFTTLKALLQEMEWDPQAAEEPGVLKIDFSADDLPVVDALAIIRFEIERFVVYFNLRHRPSSAKRKEVMDFITRANWGLLVGNFEMDPDTGALRYKSSVDFTQSDLTKTLIRNAIVSAMDTVEHYAHAIEEVAAGQKTSADAYRDTESSL